MFTPIGLMALALGAAASSSAAAWAPANELLPFSKRLQDGSTLALEHHKFSEITTQFFGVPEGEAGRRSAVAYKETVFRCRLVRVTDHERKTVWETDVGIAVPSALWPHFVMKDVELFEGKLYLLYAFRDGVLTLTTLVQEIPGRWTNQITVRLDDSRRSLSDCRFVRDSGRLGISCVDPRLPSPREEKWDIHDGVPRKRPAPPNEH